MVACGAVGTTESSDTAGRPSKLLGQGENVPNTPIIVTPTANPTPGPSTNASPLTQITVKASSISPSGSGALMTLNYKGVSIGAVEVLASYPTDYIFSVPFGIDAGAVEIVFSTAADSSARLVRSLKIDSINFGGVLTLPTDRNVVFDRGEGSAALDGRDTIAGTSLLLVNGSLRVPAPSAKDVLTNKGNLSVDASVSNSNPGFYIDSVLGADSNPGTVERPWRSLARLRNIALQTGHGIYLRCGRVWRESVELNAQQLKDASIVSGYGPECGQRPATISGADDFSGGWIKNGKIWSRKLPIGTPKIAQLFVNGAAMRIAQWPEAPFSSALVDFAVEPGIDGLTKNQFPMSSIEASTLADKDLIGATVHLRTQKWLIETATIVAFSDRKALLDRNLEWPAKPDSSYVLQDKLWMLSAPGTYFHDTTTQRLYLIAPGTGVTDDLNAAQIEGTVRDTALVLSQRSGLVVRDIEFRRTKLEGIRLTNAPQATLSRLIAVDNLNAGIRVQQFTPVAPGTLGTKITDCTLSGNGQYGIDATHTQDVVVQRNRIMNTGLSPHQQANTLAAISTGVAGSVIENVVDGAGSAGIRFSTFGSSTVTDNTIVSACRRLTDCGAIYSWVGRESATKAQASTVAGNRAYSSDASSETVVGIYLDDFSGNVNVRNNLIAGYPMGVLLHNASNTTVENNRIWFPSTVGVFVSMDQNDRDWSTGNVLRNNQIVPYIQAKAIAKNPLDFTVAQAIWFNHSLSGELALANGRNLFSGNRIFQLQGPVHAYARVGGATTQRMLDDLQWVALNPGEIRPSRPLRFDTLKLTLGTELIRDGQFTKGLANWRSFETNTASQFLAKAEANVPGCENDCVSLRAGSNGDLLASQSFRTVSGQTYVYRWKALLPSGSSAIVGSPYVSRDSSPWDSMETSLGYVGYGTRRISQGEALDFETFFIAKESSDARVNLQIETSGVPVFFDNVSIRAVLASTPFNFNEWATIAFAQPGSPQVLSCEDFGWPPNCKVVGLNGEKISVPFLLDSGADKILLRFDSEARR
jgi:parallel beta-helix repeat protein